jgi:hypothetical protein
MILMAAIVLSVQFEASAASAKTESFTPPCIDHELRVVTNQNTAECATHCVSESLSHLVAISMDRVSPPEVTATPVVYITQEIPALSVYSTMAKIEERHPPDNKLYLITQRLRI